MFMPLNVSTSVLKKLPRKYLMFSVYLHVVFMALVYLRVICGTLVRV